jgi:hypothetical protein
MRPFDAWPNGPLVRNIFTAMKTFHRVPGTASQPVAARVLVGPIHARNFLALLVWFLQRYVCG